MTFPLPYVVGHRAYLGAGEDAHGNPIQTWSNAVDRAAFWWSASSTEPAVAGHDRVSVDLTVILASSVTVNPMDRIVVDGTENDVIGFPEDYDHGPWWVPGVRAINLRRVEG